MRADRADNGCYLSGIKRVHGFIPKVDAARARQYGT